MTSEYADSLTSTSLSALAGHLVLDSTYTSELHHRRNSSGTSSLSSPSSTQSSMHSNGLALDHLASFPTDHKVAPLSEFGTLDGVSSAPFSVDLEQHQPVYEPSTTRVSYHTRQASISSSSDFSSSDSSPGDPTSYDRGAHKRVPSTRRARSDSLPYTRSDSHSSHHSDSDSEAQEMADLFAHANMNGYHSGSGSISSSSESDSEWGSRRSSMSNTSWSFYDPTMGNTIPYDAYDPNSHPIFTSAQTSSAAAVYINPNGFDFLSQDQTIHPGDAQVTASKKADDEKRVEETNHLLEGLAASATNATTSSAQDRARGAFVQGWLGNSYMLCDEGNVSRQGLYASYLKNCDKYGVKAINSASFGKAVRQRFTDIKTRRLGVRGASRYHYCGIRPANSVEAAILEKAEAEEKENTASTSGEGSPPDLKRDEDEGSPEDGQNGDGSETNMCARLLEKKVASTDNLCSSVRRQTSTPASFNAYEAVVETPTTARPKHMPNGEAPRATRHRPRRSTGKNLSISVPAGSLQASEKSGTATAIPMGMGVKMIASFPSIEEALVNSYGALDPEAATMFWDSFRQHSYGLVEAVRSYRFDQVELNIRNWWSCLPAEQRNLIESPALSALIHRADAAVYAEILEFLHAQILVNLPAPSFASLRGLADHMEQIQTVALAQFEGHSFRGPKVELAARFGHLITRHLGICQLAQALSGIVSHPENIQEMATSWGTIDFEAIKNQSALVSNCEHDLLTECFEGFRTLLHNPGPVPIDSIIRWADQCFDRCVSPPQGNQRQMSPRSVLIRWSFVTSQIMRDLTLRSAPSFGSFQIVSLFFDEFLSFQVLRRVALQISAVSSSAPEPFTPCATLNHPQPDQPSYLPAPVSVNQDLQWQTQRSYSDGLLYPTLPATSLDDFSPHSRQMLEASTVGPPFHVPTSLHSSDCAPLNGDYDLHKPSHGLNFDEFGSPGHLDVMDVERFGELHFESSPSMSPENCALSPEA